MTLYDYVGSAPCAARLASPINIHYCSFLCRFSVFCESLGAHTALPQTITFHTHYQAGLAGITSKDQQRAVQLRTGTAEKQPWTELCQN